MALLPVRSKFLLLYLLFKASTLPLRVNSNVGFYAICKLAISLLNIDNDINRLRPTKLYFLMDRILVENPEDRVFMYI